MSGPALPVRLTLASVSSERPDHQGNEVLSADPASHWTAASCSGRIELELHPPSALHSLLIYNAGATEIAIYASDKARHDFDRRYHIGSALPRAGHAEQAVCPHTALHMVGLFFMLGYQWCRMCSQRLIGIGRHREM